jgi:hypothetical protein
MAPGEPGTGLHGGQDNLPKALITPRPVDGRDGLPEAVDRLTIVPLSPVGVAEVEVCQRVQDDIPIDRGEREGALGGVDGLVIRAHNIKIVCQKGRDLSQSPRIVEGFGEGLSLA